MIQSVRGELLCQTCSPSFSVGTADLLFLASREKAQDHETIKCYEGKPYTPYLIPAEMRDERVSHASAEF